MDHHAAMAAFAFDCPDVPVSLYDYAPVLRVRDRRGDWVLKRTGIAHSSGTAIGDWLGTLSRLGVDVVAPARHLSPNPRRLEDGTEWVVYRFIDGVGYRADDGQIADAGRLLGRIHAAGPPEARHLLTHDRPVLRTSDWIARQLASAAAAMRSVGVDPMALEALVLARNARAVSIDGLPLAGCSCDFKASYLVFAPRPTLIDPDHAARIPRLYDLAVALLLFHCDLRTAPDEVWTDQQWRIFLAAYRREVSLVQVEEDNWDAVLNLAWLDQALWLLGNWPEG